MHSMYIYNENERTQKEFLTELLKISTEVPMTAKVHGNQKDFAYSYASI